jgi:hypothetical protein
MGLLSQMAKSIFESSAGRIHWRGNMWAIVGGQWDKARIRNKNLAGTGHKSINEHGELISSKSGGVTVVLVKKRAVNSCPKPPGIDFYKGDRGFSVPATECRKCPCHRASSQAFRFPRCVYGRPENKRDIQISGIDAFNSIVNQAVGKAKKLLR